MPIKSACDGMAPVRYEFGDCVFETWSHGHRHPRCAGLQERGERIILIFLIKSSSPILLASPKVRVQREIHVLPLEGSLEKTNITPNRIDIWKEELRVKFQMQTWWVGQMD